MTNKGPATRRGPATLPPPGGLRTRLRRGGAGLPPRRSRASPPAPEPPRGQEVLAAEAHRAGTDALDARGQRVVGRGRAARRVLHLDRDRPLHAVGPALRG